MDISIEQMNGADVVVLSGRLDAAGAPEMESSCRQRIDEGARRLLLDMGGVEYVSSAGLRSLLVLAKAIKTAGGTMVLCGLTDTVREVMTISGFHNILTLATDRAAALDLLN